MSKRAAEHPQAVPEITGARMLEGPSVRGGGNLLYVVEDEDASRLLKLYRQRRSAWRAPWRNLGHLLEGKRRVDPAARAATERELLTLWASAGFDVPQVLDFPLPPGVEPPGIWMAYCPGPTLEDVCHRDGAGAAPLVERFASSLARRQAMAVSRKDVRLVHEHASVVHVLVFGERLVSFDLEGAWRTSRLLRRALAEEIAGIARSICKAAPAARTELLEALRRGYGDDARLGAHIRRGLHGGLVGRIRRFRGAARKTLQGKLSKRDALRMLQERLH